MRWVLRLTLILILLGTVGAGVLLWAFITYGQSLPEHRQLADYQPPVVTRLHAGDGRLLAEYATQHRIYVPVAAMPNALIKAFLAAEDADFFSHIGIDLTSLAAAVIANIRAIGTNRRPRGASTITQQVAKNFLLTSEVSIERKIKEAILALRIERALSKTRILELYLNEIYLGFGSYGVAAAALNYFDKSLDELTIAEAAFLAALPKAPNNYDPIRRRTAAMARRNWVIAQMQENGFISASEAAGAREADLVIRSRSMSQRFDAAYFTEEVRRQLLDRFKASGLYGGGLSVRTTLDTRLQAIAEDALRFGLEKYDRRHGWRGPIAHLPQLAEWEAGLRMLGRPAGMRKAWKTAVVIAVERKRAQLGLADGSAGVIPLSELRWARQWRKNQRLDAKVTAASDVLVPGDVVFVEPITTKAGSRSKEVATYGLRQIPDVGGAIIAIDPHTGRVLAMSGGWNYGLSEFNRATQARRQPGSAFKPFVYLAALDHGWTPTTRILDAPFVLDQGPALGKWKPSNYSNKFYGPSALRLGLEKSRNLMTVRLAQTLGMPTVVAYARRFGISDAMPLQLSMALGAGETTLLRMSIAYAMLVNGGKRVTATLIDQVQDRNGRTVFRHDQRRCPRCRPAAWSNQPVPWLKDEREQVADPASAYQIVRLLEGVVTRGTARDIASLNKPLAGKTGTTNDNIDAWFVGFTPDLVVGTFVGFDNPRTLGPRNTGSTVAAPIFKRFMAQALDGMPEVPFRAPPGILHVRIDAETGLLARADDTNVIVEAFKSGTEPTRLRGRGRSPTGRRPESTGGGSPPALAGPIEGLY